jgi:hypothetical protein
VDTQGVNATHLKLALAGENMQRALKAALHQQNLEHCYSLDVLTGADVAPQRVLEYYAT